jgi:TatD DNase family protein
MILTDAHCHPFDLLDRLPEAEAERRKYQVACAASSWNREHFEYIEALALKAGAENAPPLVRCFAVHPQLPAGPDPGEGGKRIREELFPLLESLAAGGRLDAVGETGFDLYDREYKATEKFQDEIFALHLKTALGRGLPLVLHVRRAMHKIFPFSGDLKKLPAVIFHSWPGTLTEAESLLRRGLRAFFSFGAVIVNNHREARRCCASLPADSLLLETDAPWQPPRGKSFSSWEDLPLILRTAAELRKGGPGGTAEELRALTAANFSRAFGVRL